MSKRFLLLTMVVLLAVAGPAGADPASADAEKASSLNARTFQLKHKDADKAAAMIKTLMSAEGSVSIQPGTNALVVTDHADNLKAIVAAVTQYDVPAQPVQLSVRLISAARAESPKVADELKDVAGKLAPLLRYNVFENAGVANVEGREGEQGFVDVGNGYRADFKFGEYDPATDSVRVSDFKLSRLQGEALTQLMKTSLNLKVGQMTIMSAARDPQSARALMIVFTAKR
jgi:hypothetical protein